MKKEREMNARTIGLTIGLLTAGMALAQPEVRVQREYGNLGEGSVAIGRNFYF